MINLSKLWTVNVQDFVEGLGAAVIMAAASAAWQLVSACVTLACVVSSFSWTTVENAAVVAFIGYLATKFSLASNGKLFGVIGPGVKPPSA